jgi:pyrroloquinoline quinone biosynthesis protein D
LNDGADVPDAAVPRLPRGVRLRQDAARGGWVLLAPERILQPDPVAVEILTRVDGQASLAQIVDSLAAAFSAERAQIDADVRAFLGNLAEKGFLEFDQ